LGSRKISRTPSRPTAFARPMGIAGPFGADARGTVFSNGAGVVVLRRLADALAEKDRIWGVIQGSALNNDGRDRVGYTARPAPPARPRVIRGGAPGRGASAPSKLSYVEAHGTGTSLGDPIEIEALTQALRSPATRPGACGVGSLKGNFGHLDAAAGLWWG
jgi:phthiocerol/phenolphthiocerol synthesis type-I polyketide synthase E